MADGKITRQEIFSPDVFTAFDELTVKANLLLESFTKMAAEGKKLNAAISSSKGFKEYSTTVTKAKENINQLSLEEREYAKIIKQLETEQAKLNLVQTEENKILNSLKRERRLANKQLEAEKGSIAQLRAENARLAQQRDRVNTTTKKGRAEIARLNTSINQNNAIIRKNTDELSRQKIGIGKYTSAITGLIPKILGQAGLIGGFYLLFKTLRSGVKIVAEFDQSTRKLASILGTTRKETKGLNDEAKLLGSLTKFTATQVTDLQIELAKLGFTANEISASTEGIIDFAVATGSELGAAAKTAAIALRVFNKDASQMDSVVASLAVGTTKSALAFEDYETILSTVGPVANAYNFTLEDTIGLTGRLRDAGFDASSAATATRNILLNLADANGGLAKSLGRPVKSLDDLVEGLKELNNRGVSLSETLELTDKRSVSAFNRFLTGAESARELRDQVTGANEALEAMVDEQMKALTNQVALLKSAWEGLILSIESGEGVISRAVTGTLGTLTDALTELANLDLIFTRSSKLTEDQVKRTFDVLNSFSRAKKGLKFQEVIDEFDKINYVLLKFDQTQEKAFKNAVDNAGFSAKEQNLLWDEYLRRRKEQFDLELKAVEDYQKRKAEIAAKEEKLSAREIIEINKWKAGKLTAEDEKFIEEYVDRIHERTEAESEMYSNLSDQTLAYTEENIERLRKYYDEEIKLLQNFAQDKTDILASIADTSLQLTSALARKEVDTIDERYEREKKIAQDKGNDITGLERRQEEERKKVKKKYAIIEMGIRIAEVWAQAASGLAKSTAAAAPFLANPITAAIGAVLLANAKRAIIQNAIVSTGVIAAQQAIAGSFAKGTDYSPEGLAVVGEKGHELMINKKGKVSLTPDKASMTYLEKGTKIIPADMTRKIMQNTIMANVLMSSGKRSEAKELIDQLRIDNAKLRNEIRTKKETYVNINSAGITVMTESGRTLQHRIDKYFRT